MAINPEEYRNIYKYTTEGGGSWNGYRLKLQHKGELHLRDFAISEFNGSWWKAGRAVVKARKDLIKKLNIR